MAQNAGFDTGAVANFLLDLADREGRAITPMKLQKLLYFAHGWHLALTEEPLLNEQIEAWKWGPVVPSIYHEFKEFGAGPIEDSRVCRIKRAKGRVRLVPIEIGDSGISSSRAKAVIRRVWKVFKRYTALQLSNMTHQPGTPWREVWDGMGPQKKMGKDIPDDTIRDYFHALITRESHGG